MLVAILILLLVAAAAGVLGAALKAALVLALGLALAAIILVAGTYYYLRHRVRRFIHETDTRSRSLPQRGPRDAYPAEGSKRSGGGRQLPE